jgi:hypothetical protein
MPSRDTRRSRHMAAYLLDPFEGQHLSRLCLLEAESLLAQRLLCCHAAHGILKLLAVLGACSYIDYEHACIVVVVFVLVAAGRRLSTLSSSSSSTSLPLSSSSFLSASQATDGAVDVGDRPVDLRRLLVHLIHLGDRRVDAPHALLGDDARDGLRLQISLCRFESLRCCAVYISTMLYYTMRCCAVCYTILYYTMLRHTITRCYVLYYTTLYYATQCYIALCCVLYYIILHHPMIY